MPQMGVSVSEGTITRWLKQPGEASRCDEPLLEISTDKVDTEVPSPGEGIVTEIRVQEGETVEVGTVLAVIGAAAASSAPEPSSPEPAAGAGARCPAADGADARRAPLPSRARRPSRRRAAAPVAAPVEAPATAPSGNGRTFVSPVVARIAAQHGVDPSAVPGTGQGGRVTKKDILAFIESGAAAAAAEPRSGAGRRPSPSPPSLRRRRRPRSPPRLRLRRPPSAPGSARGAAARARLRRPRSLRRHAAEPAATGPRTGRRARGADDRDAPRRRRAHAPLARHLRTRDERDRGRHVAGRRGPRAAQEGVPASYGVNPTYLAFIAKAAVETLADWPWVNGEIRGEKIVTRPFVNLGIAVALEDGKGLIVPVIRNAQDLNLLGVARAIAELAEKARTKKLMPDDVQGGTFTITNPGGFGTFHGTPIISQPQAGILGTYALVKRPWVVQDELGQDVIAIRPMMNITLTYDHRLVDGAYAGGFLRDLRARLEGWDDGGAA